MQKVVLSSVLTAALVVAGIIGWTYIDRSARAGDESRREFAATCQNLGLMSDEERADMLAKLSISEKRKLLVTIDECVKAG